MKRKGWSQFIDATAMGDDTNRYDEVGCVFCIQHTPVTHPKLVLPCESSGQGLGLCLVTILTQPLDFCRNSFGIESEKVFKPLAV